MQNGIPDWVKEIARSVHDLAFTRQPPALDWFQRMTVHASKTEHHADGGIRQIPLFPELLPHLRDCFEQAEPGTEYVITRCRDAGTNLRTQLTRIIKRAGLTL